ncbi:hypothetical protein [uncultured Helicobacter sp.]|uniref:hypothetical protein n=1 Tax=uncultured Helicobacter sp. TaxID=175537 RepID=UPI00374F5F5A
MLNKYIISIHSSKKSVYVFCKDGACIDCKSIYEECLMYLQTQGYNKGVNQESNTQTNTEVSITLEELQSYKPSLFFYSTLLLGSSEIQSNPFLFGTPDTKSNIGLDESKPIYHFSPKDEENNLGTLTIFLNSCTLTLLNYSLLDSSLNIKLECNSKESKAILEREQIQREQIQRDSNSIDSLTSTAMLHPILEDDEIKVCYNINLAS